MERAFKRAYETPKSSVDTVTMTGNLLVVSGTGVEATRGDGYGKAINEEWS